MLGLLLMVGVTIFSGTPHAAALNYTDNPMEDSIFRASFTMTAQDIQNFLVNKGSGLANYSDIEDCGSPGGSHYSFYATYYSCGTRQVAAQIIYDASQAYGINPQAILATMQKEQSLITTPNPTGSQVNYAMGYGCPDSGSCGYAGFFNQVDNGTWQFRTDYELSSGLNYWGYTPASYPCNGATRYYNNALRPGNDVTFIDDHGVGYTHFVIQNASTATLYCYTPHVFPGSPQQYYSGSYWFVYYFAQWFGASTAPYAFKSPSVDTVYLYVNGYKVSVPAMGLLQDYGVNPNAIQTLSQNRVDAIPSPSVGANGVSPTLSYLAKSPSDSDTDGGALYLVTVGKKYRFTSLEQLADYGFSTSNISYLPLSFLLAMPGTGSLSNFISTPTSSAFKVSDGKKQIIFDYPTYTSLNPSGASTPVSYYAAGLVQSGSPITTREILVKYSNSDTVYLYLNSTYYTVPTFDTYNCWGFDVTLGTPVYKLADNNYISPISSAGNLNCFVKNGSGTNYLLSRDSKYKVPSGFGIGNSQASPNDIITLSNKLPTKSSDLSQYIRGKVSPTVWSIESGVKKQIPTYSNFLLLGLSTSQLDYVDDSALSAITSSGIKLGTGQVVKPAGSSSVYVISGNKRLLYASGNDFLGYSNAWGSIETYPLTTLDSLYPYQNETIKSYFYSSDTNSAYLMDPSGCYSLSSSQLTAYGKTLSGISSAQTYGIELFPGLKLNNCKSASLYVKDAGSSAVYLMENGQKRRFNDWPSLTNYAHQANPYIITLSTETLSTFANGSSI